MNPFAFNRWRPPGNRRRIRLLGPLVLMLALGAGWWLAGHRSASPLQPALPEAWAAEGGVAARQAAADQYVCPMMCIPPTDQPGQCPVCGMELVAVAHDHGADSFDAPRLALSPRESESAGIQVSAVSRRPAVAEVRLFGRIDYDPAHSTVISAFMPGVIDRIYVRRAGQFVRWGDPLFDLYSSDLLETQQQLAQALKYVPGFLAFQRTTPHVAQDMPIQPRQGGDGGQQQTPEAQRALQTIAALRHKLSILGLPKRDIDEFMKVGEATGVATVYAPMYGQVTVQNAYEGTFVNRGTPVMTIADPKYVWLRMDAYEMDYAWIRKGQEVAFTTEAYPGETFHGSVVFIDPVFDPESRSFRVGAISTEDQGGRLKAGMLARAVIEARLDADGRVVSEGAENQLDPLVIPHTAPLITGRRAVVYVADGLQPGVYEGREVILGPRTRDGYVVREGLAEGEQVVVNGAFKIDSALQIQARPSLMHPAGSSHDHGRETTAASPGPDAPEAAPASRGHDPGALPQAPEAARERVPVDAYQRPGDSDRMHDHYMQLRQESRTITNQPAQADAEQDDAAGRSLRRRRPGHYGDPTRPGIPPTRP
jgi:Cu(I)/Ag(I) efflux system membrane fusion protein